jgi:hypothetical protein
MKHWDGKERRKAIESDGAIKTGRRKDDEHCGQHEILWRHHDDDTKNHRQLVCGKIKGVDEELTAFQRETRTELGKISSSGTPWKVFALSMVLVIGSIGGSIAWLARYIDRGQDEIKTSVGAIHRRISENDGEISGETKLLKDAIYQVNRSILMLDNRILNIENEVRAAKEIKK